MIVGVEGNVLFGKLQGAYRVKAGFFKECTQGAGAGKQVKEPPPAFLVASFAVILDRGNANDDFVFKVADLNLVPRGV